MERSARRWCTTSTCTLSTRSMHRAAQLLCVNRAIHRCNRAHLAWQSWRRRRCATSSVPCCCCMLYAACCILLAACCMMHQACCMQSCNVTSNPFCDARHKLPYAASTRNKRPGRGRRKADHVLLQGFDGDNWVCYAHTCTRAHPKTHRGILAEPRTLAETRTHTRACAHALTQA
jgi:hypothetical protein